MFQQFVGREKELEFLENMYNAGLEAQFAVIYGRRRVGKTELVKTVSSGKPHVYFLADERGEKENLRELQKAFAVHFQDSLLEKAGFGSWLDLFLEVSKKKWEKRLIIAIDEFPYLIKSDKATPSVFQKIWDSHLSKKNVLFILLGSSISMMEKKVLAKNSPLYGRRTGQWKLMPLEFRETQAFLPHWTIEEQIKAYSIADGIPLYLKKLNHSETINENLAEHVLKNGAFLYEEAEILLKSELREPANYFNILKAIASGKNRFGEIANTTELEKSKVSKYLSNLIMLHFIQKEFPVTQKKETRNTHYVMTDNYYKFWFRFVYPNKSLILQDMQKTILAQQNNEINMHYSQTFEQVCLQALWKKNLMKFNYSRIGRWWHKDREIDIVALNETTKDILFAECKWQNKVNAEKLLEELKEKSKYVQWHNNERKEHYALFAKSFSKKIDEKNIQLIGLKDIEKLLKL